MQVINKQWFEVVVQYAATGENGDDILTKERQAIDAMSFTEAEERAVRAAKGHADVVIKSEIQAPYSEILADSTQGDAFYKATVQFSVTNEKTGKIKRSNSVLLVQSGSIAGVMNSIDEYLKASMTDWEIISIAKTKVAGYYIAEESK